MDFINDFKKLNNYLIFWLGQSMSALGSSMTGFALSIWAYQRAGNALTLSISGLALMLPKMFAGVLAGPIIDRLDKKPVMIFTDLGMGVCSLLLFLLLWTNNLEIWHVYCLNLISGLFAGISSPANDVAISLIVPKELYVRANGLRSAASGLVEMLSPVLAAIMLGFVGMPGLVIFDFATMIFAVVTLGVFVKIPKIYGAHGAAPNQKSPEYETQIPISFKKALINYFRELACGFTALKSSRLLLRLMLYFSFVNLVAGITYFNLITPMILARSGGSSKVLGLVNGAIGLGGITGGFLATLLPKPKSRIKTIFACTALSFLFGDTLFALGTSQGFWIAAGFLSCLFIPVIDANSSYFWRTLVPLELQGRTFALKYAFQTGMIPIGMLLGGFLADYAFEPLMKHGNFLSHFLGSDTGSGMALMFLITGVLGTSLSIMGYFSGTLRKAEAKSK